MIIDLFEGKQIFCEYLSENNLLYDYGEFLVLEYKDTGHLLRVDKPDLNPYKPLELKIEMPKADRWNAHRWKAHFYGWV
jgi:hypothetical protein